MRIVEGKENSHQPSVSGFSSQHDPKLESPNRRTRPFYPRKSKNELINKVTTAEELSIDTSKAASQTKKQSNDLSLLKKPANSENGNTFRINKGKVACTSPFALNKSKSMLSDSIKTMSFDSMNSTETNSGDFPDWNHLEPSLNQLISSDIGLLFHLYLFN